MAWCSTAIADRAQRPWPAMTRLLASAWPYHAIRFVLGGLFLWAGVLKMDDPMAFAEVIEEFRLVPPGWVIPLARTLPFMEVIVGAGLILDVPGSRAGLIGLLLLFLGVLVIGISRGLDVDCGCFGPGDLGAEIFHRMEWAVFRDLVMLAGAVYLAWWRRGPGRTASESPAQSD